MAKGRKPDNVAVLPGALGDDANEPNQAHNKLSQKMRPQGLSKDQKKIWDRLGPRLVMMGRLKPHFVDAFADYCYLRAKLSDIRKELDEEEWYYIVEGRNGQQHKAKPSVAQANEIWRQIRTYIGEFGLAPASNKGLSSNQGDLFDDEYDNI